MCICLYSHPQEILKYGWVCVRLMTDKNNVLIKNENEKIAITFDIEVR